VALLAGLPAGRQGAALAQMPEPAYLHYWLMGQVSQEGGPAASREVAFYLNEGTKISTETDAGGNFELNIFALRYFAGVPITFETVVYTLAVPPTESSDWTTAESFTITTTSGYMMKNLGLRPRPSVSTTTTILSTTTTLALPPKVNSINPVRGVNNEVLAIKEIVGQHFRSGARVNLSLTGDSDIVATAVNVVDHNKLTCQLDLRKKTPGAWDVTVTNDDNQADTLPHAFKVEAPLLELLLPPEFSLPAANADPLLRTLLMKYTLSKDAEIEIAIFNRIGEKIWANRMPSGTEGGTVGTNAVAWNCRTQGGLPVGAGPYIIMIYANQGGQTKLLVKQSVAIVK
jgi:hypothetical protein